MDQDSNRLLPFLRPVRTQGAPIYSGRAPRLDRRDVQTPPTAVMQLPLGKNQDTEIAREVYHENKGKTASTFRDLRQSYNQGTGTGSFLDFIKSLFS